MASDRRARILARLSDDATDATSKLCEVAAEVTAMTGAGIMLASGASAQGSICTTDNVSELLDNLQYTLGEGPGIDAHTSGTAVLDPDLVAADRTRWPAFTPAAIEAGARAVFGFPLKAGTTGLGALNLYRDLPGPLTAEQFADALVMTDIAARAILAMQAAAATGEIAAELELRSNFNFVVHQAAGMISIQLDVTVSDALVRLRSHAFSTNRLIGDVAGDVVDRRLRFEDDRGG
jgi:hypothetical protein